jgi:formyltetrahydrofolate deformylase
MTKKFTLIISCEDTLGIVAEVSNFIAKNNLFILGSAQMGDESTGKFFMRIVCRSDGNIKSAQVFKENFTSITEKFKMKVKIFDNDIKTRTLILVSKQGHCLNDILHRYSSGALPIDIAGVISNHQDMRKMVESYDLPYKYLPVNKDNKTQQEQEILDFIENQNVDLTVLARYMQILSPNLVKHIKDKAINIHHSFLPSFKGAKPYHQAYDRGVKIIGATAHYVSDDLDEGPIIEQEVTRVNHSHTPDKLLAIGRDIESIVLSRAIKYHVENRVILNDNKTVVFS